MDREKVINQLDVDIQRAERTSEMLVYVGRKTAQNALSMLKEQEAVEPKHNPLSPTDWFCGKCGMCISRFHDYCPSCGQVVKWE